METGYSNSATFVADFRYTIPRMRIGEISVGVEEEEDRLDGD